jgi:hypothetical protein
MLVVEAIPTSQISLSCSDKTMVGVMTCEVREALTPLNVGA